MHVCICMYVYTYGCIYRPYLGGKEQMSFGKSSLYIPESRARYSMRAVSSGMAGYILARMRARMSARITSRVIMITLPALARREVAMSDPCMRDLVFVYRFRCCAPLPLPRPWRRSRTSHSLCSLLHLSYLFHFTCSSLHWVFEG